MFPGQQGGPLEHIIAGKAVALRIAATEAFRERQERTLAGARAVGEELLDAGGGVSVLTGGTDVHLVLCDLRESELDGKQAEDRLHSIGITVNRNAVPFDPRPPAVSSGLRIGTPGAGHPRAAGRGLRRGGQDHRGRPEPRGAFEDRRAELAERVRGDRRALPAVRAARRRRRGLSRRRGAAGGRVRTPAVGSGWHASLACRTGMPSLLLGRAGGLGGLTPVAARLARRIGAVDVPRERGLALRETPLLGGLAILAGVLVAAAIWLPPEIKLPHTAQAAAGSGGTVHTWAVHRRRRA